MKNSNNEWFKHLQHTCDVWVDPETERKDKKNTKIMSWGLGTGAALWILFALGGSGVTGFILFFICWFGSFMLTED